VKRCFELPPPKDPAKYQTWLNRISRLGSHLSEAQKKRVSDGTKKAMGTPEVKLKLSANSKINSVGEKNGNYKGDAAGYDAIHKWVRSRKPKPEVCEICDTHKKTLVLACMGKYQRDPDQFKWVCWGCHNKHDHENPRHPQKYFPNAFTENGQKIKRSAGVSEVHE